MVDNVLTEQEQKCLEEVKQLIRNSSNERTKRVINQDEFLLRFVRGRKFNSQQAFDTLETNFRVRLEKYPELFSNLRPSALKHVFDSGMMGILKHRDSFGRKIVYFRIRNWDLEVSSADDIMMACILYAEEMAHSKETQLNGIIMICDYKDFTWGHARHYSLNQMRMFINIFLYSYPTRFGQGHMLNAPPLWQMAYNIFKPFLPLKVKQRVFLSREGHKSLHENISPDILPQWLGGSLTESEAEDPYLLKSIFDKEEFYANFNDI